MEVEMVRQFIMQLSMCEVLSANFLIQPSMAFNCSQIETFILESYFDNDYNAFIKWWDKTIVPMTEELQSFVNKELESKK